MLQENLKAPNFATRRVITMAGIGVQDHRNPRSRSRNRCSRSAEYPDSRVDFVELRLYLGKSRLHFGLQLGDLRSNDSDDVLAGYLADFLNRSMDQPEDRVRCCSGLYRGVGGGLSGHNRTPTIASPKSCLPLFDPSFSLFPSCREMIRGLMHRTTSVRPANASDFALRAFSGPIPAWP